MLPPRVVVVTATDVVPEPELLRRLAELEGLPTGDRPRVAVQLRDPRLDGRALYRLGVTLRELTGALGVRLIVNDRIDLAIALGADGVHLGRRSVAIADVRALLGSRFLSVACHSTADLLEAARAGADAVVLAPIFASPGKERPLGVEAVRGSRAVLDASALPSHLIALGGIDQANARACLEAGASGVAAIRAEPFALFRAIESIGPS